VSTYLLVIDCFVTYYELSIISLYQTVFLSFNGTSQTTGEHNSNYLDYNIIPVVAAAEAGDEDGY